MASRFLSGLAAGAVVSGLILAAISVLSSGDAPARGPQPGEVEVPVGSGFSQARDDTTARLPQSDTVQKPAFGTAPVGAAPPDDLSKVTGKGTAPARRPEISAPQTDLTSPASIEESSDMAEQAARKLGPDAAAEQSHDAESPNKSGKTSISSDPAQPDMPEIESEAGYDGAAPPSDAAENFTKPKEASDDLPAIPADPDSSDQSRSERGVTDTSTNHPPQPAAD